MNEEQLTHLTEVVKTFNSSLELDKVLEKVLSLTSKTMEAEASSLLLIDEPANRLFFKTSTGSKAKDLGQFSLKIGEGIAGFVASSREPLLVNDVNKDPRFQKEISETIDFPTKSILCVPLIIQDRIIGVIEVINKKGGFTESDSQLLLTITQQAALAVENARLHEALGKENRELKKSLKLLPTFIGDKNQNTKKLLELIEKVSPADSTLLITGETGAGKELVARMVHENSKRKGHPFTCVTCAILTETLLESELFGHEKGAFTGATIKKIGKFEIANRGTVFLDEISAIPISTQTKLLRVLQEREFERVGGTQVLKVDIRVIAATNENIENLVREGKFREDLYYRLKVIEIPVPSLRERKEEIPLLVEYYLSQYSKELDRKVDKISPDAMRLLTNYSWPGNIRELKNVIERAIVLGNSDTLEKEFLPHEITEGKAITRTDLPNDWSLVSAERWHIERALKHTQGNKSKAAELLGISRNRLDRKLKGKE